ncbi:6358_t:CDS:2, partial [Entrophospora sp. SA101]
MQSKDDELKTQVSDSSLRELNSRLLRDAELNTRIFELERSAKENEELRNRVAKLEQHQYIDTNTISLDDETNSNDTSEQIISCNEESNTLNSDIYQDSATTTSPAETISFASQSNLRRLEEKVENEFWDQELLSTPENTIPKISISPNKNASIHKAEKSLLNKDLNIQDTKLSSSESKSETFAPLYEVLLYKKKDIIAIQEAMPHCSTIEKLGIISNINQMAVTESKKAKKLADSYELLLELVGDLIPIQGKLGIDINPVLEAELKRDRASSDKPIRLFDLLLCLEDDIATIQEKIGIVGYTNQEMAEKADKNVR